MDLPVFDFEALHVNGENIAYGDFRGSGRIFEFIKGHEAFALEADVDGNVIGAYGYYFSVNDGTFLNLAVFLTILKKSDEIFVSAGVAGFYDVALDITELFNPLEIGKKVFLLLGSRGFGIEFGHV
jgi:hypothetical protein